MGKTRRKDSDIDETKKATFHRHYDARLNRYTQASEASETDTEADSQRP